MLTHEHFCRLFCVNGVYDKAVWVAVGSEPHARGQKWRDWFPGACMSGLGINMVFPMLQSSGVRDVGPERFSVANASTRAALQVGSAIGVAGLVAVLGNSAPALDRFHTAWLLIALFAVLSAALILPIRQASSGHATAHVTRPEPVTPRAATA